MFLLQGYILLIKFFRFGHFLSIRATDDTGAANDELKDKRRDKSSFAHERADETPGHGPADHGDHGGHGRLRRTRPVTAGHGDHRDVAMPLAVRLRQARAELLRGASGTGPTGRTGKAGARKLPSESSGPDGPGPADGASRRRLRLAGLRVGDSDRRRAPPAAPAQSRSGQG